MRRVKIDDDNASDPNNIDNEYHIFNDWGHNGVCERRAAGGKKFKTKLFNFGGHASVLSILQRFEALFLKDYTSSHNQRNNQEAWRWKVDIQLILCLCRIMVSNMNHPLWS